MELPWEMLTPNPQSHSNPRFCKSSKKNGNVKAETKITIIDYAFKLGGLRALRSYCYAITYIDSFAVLVTEETGFQKVVTLLPVSSQVNGCFYAPYSANIWIC